MKLDEIRERLSAGQRLDTIRLPEVPKGIFKMGSGVHGLVMGDINKPGQMYITVHQDIRPMGTGEQQEWVAEVIPRAARELNIVLPQDLRVSCDTELDLDKKHPDSDIIRLTLTATSTGKELRAWITAMANHSTFTVPPLGPLHARGRCACGDVRSKKLLIAGPMGKAPAQVRGTFYRVGTQVRLCDNCAGYLARDGFVLTEPE